MMIQRLRMLRRSSRAASLMWNRRCATSQANESAVLAAVQRRRRSRSKWPAVAVISAAAALLLGLPSSRDDAGPLARRNWLLLRSGWMLSSAFAAYTEFKRDLLGGQEANIEARAARRIQWWEAIQRARQDASGATEQSPQELMISVLVNLVLPETGESESSDVVQTAYDRRVLVHLLLSRGLLGVLVEYVALERPSDPVLLKKILTCLEIGLDEATRIPPTDTSASDHVATPIPSLSFVALGIALSHLIERETPRFADLVKLGQSLSDFKRVGVDTLLTCNRNHLETPQVIDDDFNCALKGYVGLLSPEMPPQLKEFALDALTGMLQKAARLSDSVSTRHVDAAISPMCATFVLALPRLNVSLQTSAAALMTSLLSIAQASSVPVSSEVYDLWMQQIQSWSADSSPPALQLAGANCLRVLSSHPRTRHFVRDSVESMDALFGLARRLHEDQVRPPLRPKQKNKTKPPSRDKVELPSLLDHLERTLIQKHVSRTFLNLCTSYHSGETAILESMSSASSLFHSRRSLPMSRVFRGAHDLTDLPVVGAEEYDSSTEFGWADILTHWTGSSDREIRRNAIQSLVHLVEQESDSVHTSEKQRHLLQAWLTSMLQHVRNVTGGEEILAIKQVEDIARISDEFTPGNEMVLFNPAVVDAACSALAVLAEQHYDELIHYGVVELMSLLAVKCPSDHGFDFPTQSARVIANLVATCSKSLENQHTTESATARAALARPRCDSSRQSFSYSHPLWRSFLAEVFDVGQMLESSSSGRELLAILRTWSERDDPHQRSQLFRALRNMAAYRQLSQTGRRTLPIYAEGVHPIAPVGAGVDADEEGAVDIVFVHGLRGDAFGTWRTDMDDAIDARSDVWPDILLHHDLETLGVRARVVSLGYEAGMVSWSSPWPSLTLEERGKVMLQALYAANIGHRSGSQKPRPVVFVTHSMGGLLVKKMLLLSTSQAIDDDDGGHGMLADATTGVVFLAVPHFGSDLARGVRSDAVRTLLRTHPAIQDLCASHDRRLESLNDSFADLHIDCLSIAEQKPAPLGFGISAMVVKPDSANPQIGEFFVLHGADHMTICKAKTSDDPMYQSVLGFVGTHIGDTPATVDVPIPIPVPVPETI